MIDFSCVVKCHNLLRLPHKMAFLVPWFFMSSFSTLFWRSLKFFGGGIFRLCGFVKCHNLLRLPHKMRFLVPWFFMPSCSTLVWRSVIFSFFSFVWSCEVSQSIAPATQNEVLCPMILHAIIFNHFLKNDELAFFTDVRGWLPRKMMLVRHNDVLLIVLAWGGGVGGVGGWGGGGGGVMTFVVDCHDRWCWWDIMMFCWLSWHGVGGWGG